MSFLLWTCVLIFASTGAITIIGLIKENFIQEQYLNKLFTSLIVEVIGICVLVFGQSVLKKKVDRWTISADVKFLDENGKQISPDLDDAFNLTRLKVLPEQLYAGKRIPPYHLDYNFSGDINDVTLFFTCDASSGWKPSKINDLTKNTEDIIILEKDDDDKKLDLLVNIRKIPAPSSGTMMDPVTTGPPILH